MTDEDSGFFLLSITQKKTRGLHDVASTLRSPLCRASLERSAAGQSPRASRSRRRKRRIRGLEFLAKVEKSVPQHLVGDPLRLGQVIANLINNAIKFTEQGDVYLKAELLEQTGERARLRFSVTDTGIGMTPEQAA